MSLHTTATTASAPAARSSPAFPGSTLRRPSTQTNPAPLTDMSQAYKQEAPIVVIDEKTGRAAAHLGRARLQRRRPATTPRSSSIPGRTCEYGHTYVVAMRNLEERRRRDPRRLRSGSRSCATRRSCRRTRARRSRGTGQIFKVLKNAGIKRGNLYMAWDFTVGSRASLTQNLLHIRNAAFRGLGDDNLADGKVAGHAPAVQGHRRPGQPRPGHRRYVTGQFKVPCYLTRRRGARPARAFNYASGRALRASARSSGQRRRRRRSTASSRRRDAGRTPVAARSTATGSWARAARSRPARGGSGERAQLHHLRHRLVGHVRAETSRTTCRRSRTSTASRPSSIASSRASSTPCSCPA